MSLITLTFGENYNSKISSRLREVTRPLENLKVFGSSRFEVKRISQFFGDRNIYVLGEVKSGILEEKMKSPLGNKTAFLVELDSKLGCYKAKKGMYVGLTLAGIEKDDLQKGQVIDFTP